MLLRKVKVLPNELDIEQNGFKSTGAP